VSDPSLAWALEVLQTDALIRVEQVQRLWSGYGAILRLHLADRDPVILKRVAPPDGEGLGHRRKLRSYEVERTWYGGLAARCDRACRVPRRLACEAPRGETWLLLEDLDAAGYAGRSRHLSPVERSAALAWLAAFHAEFLGEAPGELWPRGTYWHLATRPEELAATQDPDIRRSAPVIDARLEGAVHRTLVHGDAKPANFCFGAGGAAAVDFQYVGGGVGVQDVAYLLAGAPGDPGFDAGVEEYLERLAGELAERRPDLDQGAILAEWRELVSWSHRDFERFLAGWHP
jgi:hypothetical protein